MEVVASRVRSSPRPSAITTHPGHRPPPWLLESDRFQQPRHCISFDNSAAARASPVLRRPRINASPLPNAPLPIITAGRCKRPVTALSIGAPGSGFWTPRLASSESAGHGSRGGQIRPVTGVTAGTSSAVGSTPRLANLKIDGATNGATLDQQVWGFALQQMAQKQGLTSLAAPRPDELMPPARQLLVEPPGISTVQMIRNQMAEVTRARTPRTPRVVLTI